MVCTTAVNGDTGLDVSRLVSTTDGGIAIHNLHVQIEALEAQVARDWLPHVAIADLIDLLTLRGQILGWIADYDRAATLAEQLVAASPTDGLAFLARARTHATFHRFANALADLEQAEQLGVDRESLLVERTAALHQLGRSGEALALAQAAANREATFTTLASLAVLHAERGEAAAAEALFAESQNLYRQVSPFPLALLAFQRAHLWVHQGDLPRARAWLQEAVRRVPSYAQAQGHLAGIEADLGETEAAIGRLRPLAASSDDPEHAAQLARLLSERGDGDEARAWQERAVARYEELVTLHPEAFADHGADFWLSTGEPAKALRLAKINLGARQTVRAQQLYVRAQRAAAAAETPA